MSAATRITIKTLIAFVIAVGLLVAIVWPWSAPEVDWRTPLDAALAKNDCTRAVSILKAATTAGSIEAYDLLSNAGSASPCLADERLPGYPTQAASALRFARKTGETPRLSDDIDALDLWHRNYASITDFLCRRPYDTGIRTDQAVIAAALLEETGWPMTLHRQRRAICAGVVEDVAMSLADRDEPQAKELAYNFAMGAPITGSTISGIVLATVILEKQFVPRWLARGDDPRTLTSVRRLAWIALRHSAEANHPKAIAMMIALLHERRFTDDARLTEDPQNEAYLWILRSRRLGLPPAPIYAEIERALGASERADVKEREAFRWDFLQSLPAPP